MLGHIKGTLKGKFFSTTEFKTLKQKRLLMLSLLSLSAVIFMCVLEQGGEIMTLGKRRRINLLATEAKGGFFSDPFFLRTLLFPCSSS